MIDTPGRTEKILRLIDLAAESHPLCRTNLVCLLEFSSEDGTKPALDDIRQFIAAKLPEIPSLCHYLKGDGEQFTWASYRPDLEKCITETPSTSTHLENEIIDLLALKIPYDAPWKIIYLKGGDSNTFSLLWCARHEVMDAGGFASIFSYLFSEIPQAELKLPKIEDALKAVPQNLLELSCTVEEAGLFYKDIPKTPQRKLTVLQMPARLLPEIGKTFGISGNDLYLKAMGDAFWKWRKAYPQPIPEKAELPILIPINMRKPHNFDPGNRYFVGRIQLPVDFSIQNISQKTDIFRQKGMKENLAAVFAENPDLAMEQFPPVECLSTVCSNFRVTQAMSWGSYPLVRMVYAFNAFIEGMPFYSILSTYEPKNIGKTDSVSTLFCSMDAGMKDLAKIPYFWKHAIYQLAQEAGLNLSTFGEDPIRPFC